MYLVLLRNVPQNEESHVDYSCLQNRVAFRVQFRDAHQAECLGRILAQALVTHTSIRWEVSVHQVENHCWPAREARPLLCWRGA